MGHIRSNSTSATQVADLYDDLQPLLSASGWIQQGASIVDGVTNLTWRIWKNPASNSGLTKDFHVAIGHATSGTGNMFFRIFEDYLGEVVPNEFHCQRPVPTTAADGAGFALDPDTRFSVPNTGTGTGGRNLFVDRSNGGNYTPFPATQLPVGSAVDMRSYHRADANGDKSVALWSNVSGSSNIATATEITIINNAPHTFDFRSNYIQGHTLLSDDTTAVEYIIHVNNKAFMISTAKVFDDTYDAQYIGAYEPLTPFDPFPIVQLDYKVVPTPSYTREFAYDEAIPPSVTGSIFPGTHNWFGLDGRGAWTPAGQEIVQTITSPASIDLYAKGPLAARMYIAGSVSDTNYRGLLYGPLVTADAINTGIPPIEMGDEATINGNPYYFITNIQQANTGTLFRPAQQSSNISAVMAVWFPKS